jgi:hypothetical protein
LLARCDPCWHIGATKQGNPRPVTNTIAFVLGLLILGAIAVDITVYGTQHLIYLSKKMFDLIEWLAFWR